MVYIRVVSGEITKKPHQNDGAEQTFEVLEVGVFAPDERPVGFCGPERWLCRRQHQKNVRCKDRRHDHHSKHPAETPLPGFPWSPLSSTREFIL